MLKANHVPGKHWNLTMDLTLKTIKRMHPDMTAAQIAKLFSRTLHIRPAMRKDAILGRLRRMKEVA